MPSAPRPSNALHDLLEEAQAELSRRLREACDAESRGVSTESTGEIRQLEDSLLSAALAAERVIAARKHLRDAGKEAGPPEGGSTADPRKEAPAPEVASPIGVGADPEATTTVVREFQDDTGRAWRAWPVTPGLGRSHESSRRSLGDFQEGWICFEALDDSRRRRLPRKEPRWSDLPAEELNRLLRQAIDAPGRKRPGAAAMDAADRDLH